ncbi:MAG: lytic murein transglycosylase [Polyangiaceae bacterium]
MRFAWALVVSVSISVSCAASPPVRVGEPAADDGWVTASSARRPTPASAPSTTPPVQPLPLEGCGDTQEGFDGWLESFRRHAVTEGLSAQTVARALTDVTYDPEVIELDRSQAAFKLSFAELSARRITRARVARGTELLRSHAELFAKIEQRFGVAPQILAAIWGLETDFGENVGSRSCLRALATLAYDCRRKARFRGELASALRIVERGDLAPAEMVGAWAGELGQTQFLPSSYERFAIDFDGDGRVDLIRSSADALASTARYLQSHGWRRDEGYGAGSANFEVLRAWNASEVYRQVIVAFAAKLPGARRSDARASERDAPGGRSGSASGVE